MIMSKQWDVFLNGVVVADYVRKGDAINKCQKLVSKHKLNPNDDVLYIHNYKTGETIEYL